MLIETIDAIRCELVSSGNRGRLLPGSLLPGGSRGSLYVQVIALLQLSLPRWYQMVKEAMYGAGCNVGDPMCPSVCAFAVF